eukprot:CAMPEP_0201512782 /NCGR_PEP_ID=MMETSP0161_2-20130828/4968_1 /ASSEMBLY_ACC=CAM_ASM_000251 /TAXON_ID=180227 /ORGANISM="Neoparamoeba aestuarina, Strain SoJaBio B1-5/56/2" /LENGTH=141 /DNA_ID=CAMNT_0047908759 /DNA_START=83 /DNA_END=508 /DNA_ORIENTATION=+
MAKPSVRILEHRVKFFDNRPDEVNDCRNDDTYKKWLKGKTAAATVVQGTSQQESITFKVEGADVKGLTRTNKTSKFYVPVNTESVKLGDFAVGEHTHTFDKQEIENIAAARANWSLTTTFHDESGNEFCKRESSFKIVGPQ